MVDTAIFSIFHRAPPPPTVPTPPAPEPVEAAVPHPVAPIVEHPLLSSPEPALEAEPEASQPAEPEPAPVVDDIAPVALETTIDHQERPIDTAAPVHHEPVADLAPEPSSTPHEPSALEELPTYQDAIAEITELVRGAGPELAHQPEPELAHPVEPHPAELLPEPAPEELPELEPEPDLVHELEPEPEPQPVIEPIPETPLVDEPQVPLAAAFENLVEPEPETEAAEPQHEPVDYAPVEPPAAHWADEMPPLPTHDTAPQWLGPAELASIPVDADQLGLANPIVITLIARLKDSSSIELDASQSGIYRPQTFRAAPWSGFAYDQATDGRTGLAAGTRILTSRGEMEVEKLLPGDTAMTLRAPALVPIAWIGKSVATAAPIWIEAGALGPNLPRRALCLAPDQPVYVEPIPIPAARLVNGTTIRVADTEDVELFHVDVGRSEILFAEGLPLSSGDRTRLQRA